MNHQLLSIITIVLFSFSAVCSQSNDSITHNYPIKGDAELYLGFGSYRSIISENNFSSVEGTSDITNIGFNFGFDYYFNKIWSLKSVLNYDPKGFSFTSSEVKLDYATLVFQPSWHFGKMKRWYLRLGPYIGFLIDDNLDLTELRSLDYGTDFTLGIKIPIGRLLFFIESDSQGSLREILDDRNNLSDELIQRNTLSIGIVFGSKK